MKKIRRFIVVIVALVAVNVPGAAMAGAVSNTCHAVEDQLGKYGWQTQICPPDGPNE